METKENVNQEKNRAKWYFSIPVLSILFFLFWPASVVLTLLRLKSWKNNAKGYNIRSVVMTAIHVIFIIIIMVTSALTQKENQKFEQAISAGEYQTAKGLLEDQDKKSFSVIRDYFKIYDASGDYSGVEDVVAEYYDGLSDKTQFNEKLQELINEKMDDMTDEQQKYMKDLLDSIEKAKEEKLQASIEAAEAVEASKAESKAAKEKQQQEAEQAKAESKAAKEKADAENKAAKERQQQEAEQAKAESKAAKEKADAESKENAEKEKKEKDLANMRNAVDSYIQNNDSKSLKIIKKNDKTEVGNYLHELIAKEVFLESHPTRILAPQHIKTYDELYTTAFSESDQKLAASMKIINEIDKKNNQLNNLTKKYPFSLENASLYSSEVYITQRLEKGYSDNIVGKIQNEFDSYSAKNTSDWVAYNVEWSEWGNRPGDTVYVIHSSTLNPFSQQGVYSILYCESSSTTSLKDSNGFVQEVPILYMVSNENEFYDDLEKHSRLTNEIDNLNAKLIDDYTDFVSESEIKITEDMLPGRYVNSEYILDISIGSSYEGDLIGSAFLKINGSEGVLDVYQTGENRYELRYGTESSPIKMYKYYNTVVIEVDGDKFYQFEHYSS
jgi:chemotaxis protein histidine kinase CheA